MLERGALDRLVAQDFPGAALRDVRPLTGGVSADVFRLDLALPDGARSVVLRRHGPNHGGHPAALEFALLTALASTALPTPTPLTWSADSDMLGAPYVIIAHLGGTPTSGLTEAQTIAAMARALAGIHGTRLDAPPSLPSRTDPLPEALGYLPVGAGWPRLGQQLEALEPPGYTGPLCLLHGDFWPANLLWQDGRITGILDWEDAAFGDPLSDVATACLELRYIHGPDAPHAFADAYARHRPVDAARLQLWLIYVAAAAQHFMGDWRLPPDREAHMRRCALATLREAADALALGAAIHPNRQSWENWSE